MNVADPHSSNRIVKELFLYDDYRLFLKEYFEEQKRLRSSFSHRYFVRKAGLSSPSFILDIIGGKYNLTMKTLPRIVSGLGLRGAGALYFEYLVWHNQSREDSEKESYQRKLSQLRKTARFYRLGDKHLRYFESSSYAVLRELAVFAPWKGDYAFLGALCVPPVCAQRARQVVEQLCDMELLIKKPDGSFSQNSSALSTAGLPPAISRAYRRLFLSLGSSAADNLGPDQRYCAHTTLSMSRAGFKEAMKILDEARAGIIRLAIDDQKVEQVYCLILQQFPLSKDFSGDEQ